MDLVDCNIFNPKLFHVHALWMHFCTLGIYKKICSLFIKCMWPNNTLQLGMSIKLNFCAHVQDCSAVCSNTPISTGRPGSDVGLLCLLSSVSCSIPLHSAVTICCRPNRFMFLFCDWLFFFRCMDELFFGHQLFDEKADKLFHLCVFNFAIFLILNLLSLFLCYVYKLSSHEVPWGKDICVCTHYTGQCNRHTVCRTGNHYNNKIIITSGIYPMP